MHGVPEPLDLADGPVLARLDDGVLRITLNRPESLNAVTAAGLERLESVFRDAAGDPGVRVVVLRGAGAGFCSGADLADGGDDRPSTATIDHGNGVVTAIRRMDRPVVAAVHGPCAGIGVSLALACDLVVAADDAFLLLAFANIGLMPDGGATALVAASIGRARAMRMALLAERIPAGQALDWGLVSHVVPADTFDAGVDEIVDVLRAGPTRAYAATKAAIGEATLAELDGAFQRERHGQDRLLRSDDFAEGVGAFRERRRARFTGR